MTLLNSAFNAISNEKWIYVISSTVKSMVKTSSTAHILGFIYTDYKNKMSCKTYRGSQ